MIVFCWISECVNDGSYPRLRERVAKPGEGRDHTMCRSHSISVRNLDFYSSVKRGTYDLSSLGRHCSD